VQIGLHLDVPRGLRGRRASGISLQLRGSIQDAARGDKRLFFEDFSPVRLTLPRPDGQGIVAARPPVGPEQGSSI
jgi:hypothetical protein